ncbi:Cro/CI family transcriptional regulator [Utexia brackfieldae]|uniref:Cro/CI family transcriptional regulator n=1 Tax=Utexia brackfieldae TaxID=3074108 RepID=UPI00370DBB0E
MAAIKKVFILLGDKNGRGGPAKLARHFGITSWAVSKWVDNGVPPERAAEIERLTRGKVTKQELCPDFEW